MPTLAVHSFGNEHFEAFYRPDPTSAGWFRSYGTLERVALEISALLTFSNTGTGAIEFEDRYGGFSDRGDYERVMRAARENPFVDT